MSLYEFKLEMEFSGYNTDRSELVEKFYKIAISKGAVDEGGPGVRKDGNYYAYIRDLDGNKIAAKSILK